jgi:hypothetical protein
MPFDDVANRPAIVARIALDQVDACEWHFLAHIKSRVSGWRQIDAIQLFAASDGRDIPRLLGCDTQMPSGVKANLLDDGVVDTLG